jgi:hypothetical protein
MRAEAQVFQVTHGFWQTDLMRDELRHALREALLELDELSQDGEGALVGLYAVMDDLDIAIRRTQALDRPRGPAAV